MPGYGLLRDLQLFVWQDADKQCGEAKAGTGEED
jgi:hypothetical protein